jgi:hypothetical protein
VADKEAAPQAAVAPALPAAAPPVAGDNVPFALPGGTGSQLSPAMVMRLQRTAGNAAVARHLATPRAPLIQRAPPTVDVHDLPMADAGQERIRADAREKLPVWAQSFADLWYSANNGALAVAKEPEDPDFASGVGAMAKANFGVALAGNLVWAATSLIPEAKLGVILMSFGGATVGSGALSQDAPPSAMPSFKEPVARALAGARDRLAKKAADKVKDVADECAGANISDLEQQKQKLWEKLISSTYNAAEPIEQAAAAALAKGAASYAAEWAKHKHSDAVQKEGARRADERIKKDGYPASVWAERLLLGDDTGELEYKLGIIQEETMKYAVETFHPTLSFM